jgi:L-tartrate/succinate antiporter
LARFSIPVSVAVGILLVPSPAGLAPAAWRYFALFAAVIAAIITEPIPPSAVGLVGVVIAGSLRLVRPAPNDAIAWALSGFANSTVWLVFAAYMFALGYSRTGLGRRIALLLIRRMGHSTIGLGYAITLAEIALAPFTPSSTARSGATIYPVVRQIPELYDSYPNDDSARRIGGYLLYTAAAASCVTSSLFLTGMAPNALALSMVSASAGVHISWVDWVRGFAPIGLILLSTLPAALYVWYPPYVKQAREAPQWADEQLQRMGAVSRNEITLLILVLAALTMWIGASALIDPAMVALLIVALMVLLRVVTWDEILANSDAWNVLVWFATLVTLAAGLGETGFLKWLAQSTAPALSRLGGLATIVCLVAVFYYLHYLFASVTAHTATLYPVFFAVAMQTGAASPTAWALLLAYPMGLMSILTSYGAGQIPIYYGSGYVKRRDFWVLGFVVGTVFFAVYIAVIVPWLRWLGI